MVKQFLDSTGLLHLWNKISSKFLPKEGDITAPGNSSAIRLIPTRNTLNYNIKFRDLNNNVNLVNLGTFGDTSQAASGRIELGTIDGSNSLLVQPSGIIASPNSSPTKVFATNGSIADLSTVGDGKYLPLSGGTVTGTIFGKKKSWSKGFISLDTPNNKNLLRISTNGDVNHNVGTGWISVANVTSGSKTILSGDYLQISKGEDTIKITCNDIQLNDASIIPSALTEEGGVSRDYSPLKSSDISLKENIESIDETAIDAINQVEFKQFNFKDDENKTKKYGVIAQEVEKAGLENLVNENEINKKKTVDYTSLLILKIKQLENEIEILKNKLDAKE